MIGVCYAAGILHLLSAGAAMATHEGILTVIGFEILGVLWFILAEVMRWDG